MTPLAAVGIGALGAAFVACEADRRPSVFHPAPVEAGGVDPSGGADEAGAGSPFERDSGGITYGDLPGTLIDSVDGGAPSASSLPALFAAATGTSDAPCLVEPEPNTLYPKNWLRPRIRWTALAGQNAFELRFHVDNQSKDLVVYTNQRQYTLPTSIWEPLRTHSSGRPITLSLRAASEQNGTLSDVSVATSQSIEIAPVEAPGNIVYWKTTGGTALKGFHVGDESSVVVLSAAQIQAGLKLDPPVVCVGCHASTPDGHAVGVTLGMDQFWGNAVVSIDTSDAGVAVGSMPPFITPAAAAALRTGPRGIHTFSGAHWTSGDHVEIANGDDGALRWFDLEAADAGAVSGVLSRGGDPHKAAGAPSWSHDGKLVAYTALDRNPLTGRLYLGGADLWVVPYNDRAGGTAHAIDGASLADYKEFYPQFSPDDKWLAFTRMTGQGDLEMYNDPNFELFVIPSNGGVATRLSANDPPVCSKRMSPGVTNSWPKWAPQAKTFGSKTYYWTVFSSTRDGFTVGGAIAPQLYVAGIVVDAAGTPTTYGALYLWNQSPTEGNHTPAWDFFDIPPPQDLPH